MRVLVVGSGGREHALVWKLHFSPQATAVYCAPGNAGISLMAHAAPVAADDVRGLVAFAIANAIELTVVGPEVSLAAGIVELHLRALGRHRESAFSLLGTTFAQETKEDDATPGPSPSS